MNNNKSDLVILAQDELMQTDNSMSVDEYLAQLHADYWYAWVLGDLPSFRLD